MTDQPPVLLGVTPPPEVITTCEPASYGHVGLFILEDDDHWRCSICHEVVPAPVDDGRTVAEAQVSGRNVSPFAAPPACEHPGATQQVDYAVVRDDKGEVVRREVRVRARCAACGLPFRWVLPSAHFSDALGPRALVCSVEVMSDTEAADGWRAASEG